MEFLAGIGVIFWLFLFVLAICWVILPFALIGTKPLLRELIARQKETNDLLRRQLQDPVVRGTPVVQREN